MITTEEIARRANPDCVFCIGTGFIEGRRIPVLNGAATFTEPDRICDCVHLTWDDMK